GGRAGESANAGHGRRAREPPEAALRDSRAYGAVGEGRATACAESRCLPRQGLRRYRLAHQSRGEHPDADVCVRGAGAECRGAVEARDIRARAARDLAGRRGDDDPVRGHAVPLRRLSSVQSRGQSAGGARAQDRRPGRRSHGDPRRLEPWGPRGADGRGHPDRWDDHRGPRRVAMLSELCVRRPVFATMLVMSLVVLGLFSFRDLGVDLFPKADPAQVNVSLRLPGASPDEMTSAVILPMENALSGIAGIDQMTANVNTGGVANIQIRFVLERDLEDAANAVREKVAGAMRSVPPETLPPVVQKQDPDADPIMSIMLSSRTASRS